MTTLNVSRGMGNHLLCVRYTNPGADMKTAVQRSNKAPFMIVHHMKNLVSVWISIIYPAYVFASTAHETYYASDQTTTLRWYHWQRKKFSSLSTVAIIDATPNRTPYGSNCLVYVDNSQMPKYNSLKYGNNSRVTPWFTVQGKGSAKTSSSIPQLSAVLQRPMSIFEAY